MQSGGLNTSQVNAENGVDTRLHMVRQGDQGAERMLVYELPEDALGAGSSFGNDQIWVNSKATGAIERLFSLDIGQAVTGSLVIRYTAPQHGMMHYGCRMPGPGESHEVGQICRPDVRVQLQQDRPGSFRIHPAYQRRRFSLSGDMSVTETLFLPKKHGLDPSIAYQIIRITNDSSAERSIRIFAYVNLRGLTESDVSADFDPQTGTLVATNESHPDWARVFGFNTTPSGVMTSHDVSHAYDPVNVLPVTNDTSAKGNIYGVVQMDVNLNPGETHELAVMVAFSSKGPDHAQRIFEEGRDFNAAFQETIQHYQEVLDVARIETPDRIINQGVQWSKANMLRVMGVYPVARAFTNEPGVSSNVVIRDLAWFVYGNDWMLPDISKAMLLAAAGKQYPNGKMCEYFSALDGHIEDYGLNINDDTPLFILGVCHHYLATGDEAFLKEVFPAVEGAARYLLSQRNDDGLVSCSARGVNVWGIASWRNVIPDYTLNGAVTEINALCYAALKRAAFLSRQTGKGEVGDTFDKEAETLKTSINMRLLNPDNGMYYLNIDVNGYMHTDVTSDEVFPVMFGVAPDDVAFRIISRLNSPDFWTAAGLRVLSNQSPEYDPSSHVGLLGGVWPGVVFWYAFAAAKYHPDSMVRGLREGFINYLADPKKNNTVPGQFSEWFDGESLVNRGMRLSPWEPPRYLWAAVEGLAGVEAGIDGFQVNPMMPPGWKWLAVNRLPYQGREISFFAARQADGIHLYATEALPSPCKVTDCGPTATQRIEAWSADAAVVAFHEDNIIHVCVGNSASQTLVVPWSLNGLLDPERNYSVRTYNSEYGGWVEGGTSRGKDLMALATPLEQEGFYILRFEPVPDDE